MKSLFHEVESGDLSRRIDVSRPDEFGSLNININHMMSRLQILNSTLERQVTERTEQLNLVNSELQLELAQRKRTEKRLSYNVLLIRLRIYRTVFYFSIECIMQWTVPTKQGFQIWCNFSGFGPLQRDQ